MRTLMLVAASLLATFLRAQDLSPYELPADVAATVRALAKADPFTVLARLGGMDLAARAAAEETWEAMDQRARCALVRAGLRANDLEVAIGAAAKATNGNWLDIAECKRAAAVGMARCNVVDTPFDVAEFFQLMDAADTATFLATVGSSTPREIPQFFGPLHRRFGPEHQSQLELLTRSDDVWLRHDAARYFGVVKLQRARYAHFLLSQPGGPETPDTDPGGDRVPFVPRAFTLRPAGEGHPPLLVAVIERSFFSQEEKVGDATFAWRWARESKPGEVDRELLRRLIESEDDIANRIGLQGLVQLGGEAVPAQLKALAARADDKRIAPTQALGELWRRGDAEAKARLFEFAHENAFARATLWQCDREAGAFCVWEALGPENDDEPTCLEHLAQARDDGYFWGVPMHGLEAALVARAEAGPLDGPRLAVLLDLFPSARTPKLCKRAIELLEVELLAAMPLGVLEIADAAALAARLRVLSAKTKAGTDAHAAVLRALLRLGADLGTAAEQRQLWASCDSSSDAGRLAAALAAGGLDSRLCTSLAESWHELPTARFQLVVDTVLEPLRAGKAGEALCRWLASGPANVGGIDGLWTFDDPAAIAYLHRARDEREHGLHRWAIGELARRGDPAARAVVEHVIAARLYGWLDEFPTHVLTDGKRLDRVPLLMQQVESNCCTFAVVASALEDVFEVDAFVGDHGVFTRPEWVRNAWERQRRDLRWSRVADRWLFMPK